jgi:WD40 repeat protein
MVRSATDKATLEIRSDDPHVKVIVTQNGQQVKIIDATIDQHVELRSGDYELLLSGNSKGLKLSTERLTLTRGDQKVVTVGRASGSEAGPMVITEMCRFQGPAARIGEVAFAPDLRSVLTTDTSARLWEISSGRELRHFDGHQAVIHDPSFTLDGQRLLTPSRDGTVRLWDVATGQELRQFKGHQGEVWAAALSPDGRHALTGGFDRTLRLFDVATGKELRRFPDHAGAIASVVWSPDGLRAVSCGNEEGAARIWDVTAGKELLRIALPPNIRRAIFAPNGQQVLTVGKDHIVMWDANTGQEVHRFLGASSLTYAAAFTPDGRHLVTGSGDETVRLWSVATGQVLGSVADKGEIYGVAVSRDGKMLLTNGGWTGVAKLYRLPSAVWSVPEKVGEIRRFPRTSNNAYPNITCVAFTPDGRRLLEGSDATPPLHLSEPETGQELLTLEGHNGWVNAIAISWDGRLAVTGSVDTQVCLWELTTGKRLGLYAGHTAEITTAAFAPDQQRAATGAMDNLIILWDLAKGQALRKLVGHSGTVNGVDFSADGKRIVSASNDGTIRSWDAETGKELWQFMAQGQQLAARFSPSGKSILAGGNDKVVRILDSESGKQIRAFDVPDAIAFLCPLPDGRRVLLTHHEAFAVSLFDLEAGREQVRFQEDRRPNRAIVSPDGRFAACGSFRGMVYVFRLPEPWVP